jgi:DNA repair exonuclease SbcCD ATPase subunit
MNEEVIVSKYAASRSARVVLHISTGAGSLSVDRSGDSFNTTLSVVVDGQSLPVAEGERALLEAVGVRAREQLLDAINRWVLRQEEVRAVLQASPDELHRRLRDVLNLGRLDEFEAQLAEVATSRAAELREARSTFAEAERQAVASRSSVADLEERIRRSGELDRAYSDLEAAIERATPYVQVKRDDVRGDVAGILTALRATYDAMRSSTSEIQHLTADLANQVDGAGLEAATLARDAAEQAHVRATELLREAKSALQTAEDAADQHNRLAAAAMPLLTDKCPVCGQDIVHDDVVSRLQELDVGGDSAALLAAHAAVADAQAAQIEAERSLVEAQREHSRVVEAHTARSVAAARLESLWASLADATSGRFVMTVVDARDVELLPSSMGVLVDVGQAFRTVAEASQISSLSGMRDSLAREAERAAEGLARAQAALEVAARKANESSRLLKGVREGGVRVVDRAMTAVNPRFSEVYKRLAPHPTFTDLGFEHDFYRSKGRSMPIVKDPLAEVDANPAVVCSVGQLNVVALSYFLAFAISDASQTMPFVVMDDPLQSLDDVNALGFADFCRRLKLDRQVVITTHDQRFGDLLRRKLLPRLNGETMLAIDLPAWDRDGPIVESRLINQADHRLTA